MDDVQTISKTSNSPQRCVQSTIEMTCRSEKAEIEYILKCPNDRNDELDKWMQSQLHRFNRRPSTGATGDHRINRCWGTGAFGLCRDEPSEEAQVAPVEPVVSS